MNPSRHHLHGTPPLPRFSAFEPVLVCTWFTSRLVDDAACVADPKETTAVTSQVVRDPGQETRAVTSQERPRERYTQRGGKGQAVNVPEIRRERMIEAAVGGDAWGHPGTQYNSSGGTRKMFTR